MGGDAVVVFEPSRVVPLFEASGSAFRSTRLVLPASNRARAMRAHPWHTPLRKSGQETPWWWKVEAANAERQHKRSVRKEARAFLADQARSLLTKVQVYYMRSAAVKR